MNAEIKKKLTTGRTTIIIYRAGGTGRRSPKTRSPGGWFSARYASPDSPLPWVTGVRLESFSPSAKLKKYMCTKFQVTIM